MLEIMAGQVSCQMRVDSDVCWRTVVYLSGKNLIVRKLTKRLNEKAAGVVWALFLK